MTSRNKIGFVQQKAVLFKGTVRDNMKWGKKNASDNDIIEALKLAQVYDTIEEKGGLDFFIAQGGANLSGGQKQRLSVARALVRKPEILILDDSSSALDFATEARMRDAIYSLDYNPTVFIVSQRASSVMSADKIIVLDDGKCVGIGTHKELLNSCEVYKEIYVSQFGKEEVLMVDKKKNKGTLKKVFSYIGKYKYFLILSMFFAAVTVGLTLYAPILVGKAIDCIIGKGNVDFVNMKSILNKVAIIVVSTALIQWLMNVCNNKITYNVSRDLRKKAFEKIEILPFSYIDTHSKGDIVSRVITDVDQLSDGLLMGFTQFFTGVITIIGTLAFMLSVNVFITIVVVVVTPLSFFIARFIAKKTFNMFSLQSKTRGEQTSFIDEMISNQKVAEAYSMNEENKARFDKINDDLAKYSLKATFFSSITNPATRFVNSIVYAAVALFGAIMAVKGNITVGILSCFLSYANQYTKPFNEIRLGCYGTSKRNSLCCSCV